MYLENILVVIIILCSKCKSQSTFCTLTNKPAFNQCYGQINCSKRLTSVHDLINYNNWQCYSNNYYSNYNIVLDVIVEDVDEYNNLDPLVNLQGFEGKIKSLRLINSNIVSIPSQVYILSNLNELVLVQNKIEIIDLNKLAWFAYLKIVNVSNNIINEIDNEEYMGENLNPVTTIDLSHNLITSLQDNTFSKYPQLQYLDMSYNLITYFDILTFEGVTRLETLYLSENHIKEIGQSFVRFTNLKRLTLSCNKISKLTEVNFKTLTSLTNLNLSNNEIKEIENRSFQMMQSLEQLDLSYNKISIINNVLFRRNLNLSTLRLSYNNLQKIEQNSFEFAHVTEFSISNNSFIDSIEENTLRGVFVSELNLSGGKITQLGNKAFSTLGTTLISLDLSRNFIANISASSFQSLELLTKLDLSSNNLIEVSFDTSDLKNLTEYYLNCNSIKSVLNSFKYMRSLLKLDLSNNKIEEINLESFVDLINLEVLILNDNFLGNNFLPRTFSKLHKLQHLYLVNTRITMYQNNSMSGMRLLKQMNSSYGSLSTLSYDTFNDTGGLEIIDLSHNMLVVFDVNTSHFKDVQELYLNNNLLNHITTVSFSNLHKLKKLNLASNNIELFDSRGLEPLIALNYLNLSSNNAIKVDARMFENLLYLSEISLNDIETPFSFNKTINVSVKILCLSYSNIVDVGLIELFRINDIIKLVLSSNKINYLDKQSFENMPTLNWLDLSVNMINYIQPGTFQLTPNINVLNLARNFLLSIEFGVLEGLENLRSLNLSSNAIHTFSANLLHSTPRITHLSLDNNNIIKIDFSDFADKDLRELSIGGNPIPCDTFTALGNLRFGDMVVTAEKSLYNVENVHGIRCKTFSKPNQTIYQGADVNLTSYLSSLIKIQKSLYNIVEKSINETTSLKKEDLQYVFTNFANDFKEIIDNEKKHKSDQLNFSDIWYSVFENITTMTNKIFIANVTNSIQQSLNNEYNLIRAVLQDIRNANVKQMNPKPQTKSESQARNPNQDLHYLSEIRVLLYIITICLTGTIVVLVSLLIYKLICVICRKTPQDVLHSVNCHALTNSMEL